MRIRYFVISNSEIEIRETCNADVPRKSSNIAWKIPNKGDTSRCIRSCWLGHRRQSVEAEQVSYTMFDALLITRRCWMTNVRRVSCGRSLIYGDRNRRADSTRKIADAIPRRFAFEQSINRASNAARPKRKAIYILFFHVVSLLAAFRANPRFLRLSSRKNSIEDNVAVRWSIHQFSRPSISVRRNPNPRCDGNNERDSWNSFF